MFAHHTVTDRLLANIKRINSIVIELSNSRFRQVALFEMQQAANTVSPSASGSLGGEPFPFSEVKWIPEPICTKAEQPNSRTRAS